MKTSLHISTETILISWDDRELNEMIYNMFSPWYGKECLPTYEVSINRENKGYILTSPLLNARCENEKSLSVNLEFALTLLSQKILAHHIQIHASCVDFDGSGALLVGSHGAGKTTLALTAISSGLKALTDDIAIIRDGLHHVMGFPRPFRVTDSTWKLLPRIVPEECPYYQTLNGLTYVFFYMPRERFYVSNTRLKHILFLNRQETASEIREMGETEAMRKILIQGFNFYMKKDGCIKDLLTLIRNAPPLEIMYNDHWDAIGMIRDIVV
jgi:hypothetical protein